MVLPSGIASLAPSVWNFPSLPLTFTVPPPTAPATTVSPICGCGLWAVFVSTGGDGGGGGGGGAACHERDAVSATSRLSQAPLLFESRQATIASSPACAPA